MSFKCKFGLHSWDGCKCSECGKVRDAEHEVSADCGKCSRCGQVFDEEEHDWSHDCEKCSVCGKTRQNHHDWAKNCEKCSKCGQIRHNMHHIKNDICEICGHGTFYDESDGSTHNVIKIGQHIVMAENLAKKPSHGNYWEYEDEKKNKLINYGFLYDWEAAKTISPKGWHLPSKEEWESLHSYLGGESKKVYEQLKTGGESGFNSLFGGERYARGVFNNLGACAHYWSNTPVDEKEVWQFKLGVYTETATLEKVEPNYGLSVRLFKDN